MRDVIMNITQDVLLESVMPIDRVITVDSNNIVYLADNQFTINDSDIKEVLSEY